MKAIETKTYLWCSVAWTSAGSLESLALFIHIAETKVDDFKLSIEVEEQVLRLEVTMADAELVNVVHASQELLQVLARCPLLQLLVLDN